MLKIFLIIILATFASCVAYKKYGRQDVIEQRNDSEGKIVLKKYRQLISSPGEDRIATITQEYDSLGRVIKEYGFDNPNFYNSKYLVEKVYRGTKEYVVNQFVWQKNDTAQNFNKHNIMMLEEFIFPEGTDSHKQIFISLFSKEGNIYFGQFDETSPISSNSWAHKSYGFELNKRNLSFDNDKKLILDSVIKK
jgi:hypothetical protein